MYEVEVAYSTAKNTGIGLAEEEEAANGDVIGIGIGSHRLKQAAEELWIYIFLFFLLLLGFVFFFLCWAIYLLLFDSLLRHSRKLAADPESLSGHCSGRYTEFFANRRRGSESVREGQSSNPKEREREREGLTLRVLRVFSEFWMRKREHYATMYTSGSNWFKRPCFSFLFPCLFTRGREKYINHFRNFFYWKWKKLLNFLTSYFPKMDY